MPPVAPPLELPPLAVAPPLELPPVLFVLDFSLSPPQFSRPSINGKTNRPVSALFKISPRAKADGHAAESSVAA